ncbi:Transposase [Paracoccus saliphilus]|uniref:Transposase n=1 Tax=Paracoccus saliphilus TaxID=405559 RepID=A0AA45W7C8_9RHOB|nr:Transposase [Paracoccus saliphilus]
MRGTDETSGSLFSYVDLEVRIPPRRPLRKIRQVVNDAFTSLDADFEALYTDFGRPSISPERLIRASLLQILFSIRSKRQLMEQMDYNQMFRRFVGLGIDDPVWVPTVFSKIRDRLLTTEMSRKVMAAIVYRDRGDEYVVKSHHLTRDVQGLYSKLRRFTADSGQIVQIQTPTTTRSITFSSVSTRRSFPTVPQPSNRNWKTRSQFADLTDVQRSSINMKNPRG